MSVRKTLITLSLILLSQTLFATFPRGCEVRGFGFDSDYLILNDSGSQSFYLIQNRSNLQIILQRHEAPDVFMAPPLNATLDPAHWGAFASDVENLHFQCFTQDNENPVKIDCREALDVCQYPRAKFALSNMGNYWVSINKPQTQVINEAANEGIYLRW
ncbi:MAG: enhanced entry protein EnhB [Proteobacteria bacterium]|nr:enhanced entry protein EnhB [Pseudomonadota bacterium]